MSHFPDISIIIPCYNGSTYIKETLNSILSQPVSFEIIVVDDGSTDNSAAEVKSLSDSRVRYAYQENQGVSAARNHGLRLATGRFIVFFDADDIMSRQFLELRQRILESREEISMVCGEVIKFNDEGFLPTHYRGAAGDTMLEDILLYNQQVVSCPSNYMLKASFLQHNHLSFNTRLSSSADKYFLLQCAKYGRSALMGTEGALHYRVSPHSMSHLLTEKLVADNEHYYAELLTHGLIPPGIENKSVFLANIILSASNWKINRKKRALRFAWQAFITNPVAFVKRCFDR